METINCIRFSDCEFAPLVLSEARDNIHRFRLDCQRALKAREDFVEMCRNNGVDPDSPTLLQQLEDKIAAKGAPLRHLDYDFLSA